MKKKLRLPIDKGMASDIKRRFSGRVFEVKRHVHPGCTYPWETVEKANEVWGYCFFDDQLRPGTDYDNEEEVL